MTAEKRLGAQNEPGMKEVRPGVWHLRVFVGRDTNGNPVQKSKTVDSGTGKVGAGVREARAARVLMKAEVEENGGTRRTVASSGLTVAKLLDRYIAHCETQDRSPTTVQEYRRLADKVLVPRFGPMKVDRLEHEDLDAFYAELKARGLSANYIRRIHSLMSSSLRFGQKKRLVRANHNPAGLASPPPKVLDEVVAPTVTEVQEVITAAETINPAFGTMVVLAALTGARRGELCALRWSDVDMVTGTLTIGASVYEKNNAVGPRLGIKETKTRQKRRVALDVVATEALRRHKMAVKTLADRLGLDVPEDGFIFSDSPQGTEPWRPGIVTERYAKVAGKVGANTRFHTLRHFMATDAISDGNDIVTVSKRLGHSDPSMTLRTYAHALAQRDRDLAAQQGQKFSLGTGA
jgi:integrase